MQLSKPTKPNKSNRSIVCVAIEWKLEKYNDYIFLQLLQCLTLNLLLTFHLLDSFYILLIFVYVCWLIQACIQFFNYLTDFNIFYFILK